jgi:hypothetical protein
MLRKCTFLKKFYRWSKGQSSKLHPLRPLWYLQFLRANNFNLFEDSSVLYTCLLNVKLPPRVIWRRSHYLCGSVFLLNCIGWCSLLNCALVGVHYWIVYWLVFTIELCIGWCSLLNCALVGVHYWIVHWLVFIIELCIGWCLLLNCALVGFHYWIAR